MVPKRCPFCNSADCLTASSRTLRGRVRYVECQSCGARGPETVEKFKDATVLWNQRPDEEVFKGQQLKLLEVVDYSVHLLDEVLTKVLDVVKAANSRAP